MKNLPSAMSRLDNRNRGQRWTPEDSDGDLGNAPGSSRTQTPDGAASSEPKLLACPYFKHDPERYQSAKTCIGPGWLSISRLKEHLYRRHRGPDFFCLRCYAPFDRAPERDLHMRIDPPCEKKDSGEAPDGFDRRQEQELRSRKLVYNSGPDAEKWRSVYKVLFPHDDERQYPSPYYDYPPSQKKDAGVSENPPLADDLARFMSMIRSEHAQRQLRGRICEVLERRGEATNSDQLALELTDVFMNSQMEALRDFQHHANEPTQFFNLNGMDEGDPYQARATRRSSSSNVTFRDHNRAVEYGAEYSNHSRMSSLSTSDGQQRDLTPPSPQLPNMLDSSGGYPSLYEVSNYDPWQSSLAFQDFSQPMIDVPHPGNFNAFDGFHFGMPAPAYPTSLEIPATEYMTPQVFLNPLQPSLDECNEQNNNVHEASSSMM